MIQTDFNARSHGIGYHIILCVAYQLTSTRLPLLQNYTFGGCKTISHDETPVEPWHWAGMWRYVVSFRCKSAQGIGDIAAKIMKKTYLSTFLTWSSIISSITGIALKFTTQLDHPFRGNITCRLWNIHSPHSGVSTASQQKGDHISDQPFTAWNYEIVVQCTLWLRHTVTIMIQSCLPLQRIWCIFFHLTLHIRHSPGVGLT